MKTRRQRLLLALFLFALALLAGAKAEAYCQNVRVCYGAMCRWEQRCTTYRAPVCTWVNRCYPQRVCNPWGCRYSNVCRAVRVCG